MSGTRHRGCRQRRRQSPGRPTPPTPPAWINQSIQRGRRNRGEHVDRNGRTVSDVLSLDHHQDGTASIGDFLEASDDIEADVEYQLLLSGVQDVCRDGLDREILRAAIEGSPVANIGPKYGLTREAGRRRKVQIARRAASLVSDTDGT